MKAIFRKELSTKRLGVILRWVLVYGVLLLVFAQKAAGYREAFYFVSLLFPVVLGTSYVFNSILVPRYLLSQRYFRFALYFVYLLVVSVYLETWVVVFSLRFLAQLDIGLLPIPMKDVLYLVLLSYVVVFVQAFGMLVVQFQANKRAMEALAQEQSAMEEDFITVTSNRQPIRLRLDRIRYLESLSDYVKIHLLEGEPVSTKATISSFEESLPEPFLRIHRSYVVNTACVDRFTRDKVLLQDQALPVSRKYLPVVRQRLGK
ncbi:MAG: LytTR family DNA-binding domain-containing protein [Bacteroidota bacterium]